MDAGMQGRRPLFEMHTGRNKFMLDAAREMARRGKTALFCALGHNILFEPGKPPKVIPNKIMGESITWKSYDEYASIPGDRLR